MLLSLPAKRQTFEPKSSFLPWQRLRVKKPTLESGNRQLIDERSNLLRQYEDLNVKFGKESRAKEALETKLLALEKAKAKEALQQRKEIASQEKHAISHSPRIRPKSRELTDSKSKVQVSSDIFTKKSLPVGSAASTLPVHQASGQRIDHPGRLYSTSPSLFDGSKVSGGNSWSGGSSPSGGSALLGGASEGSKPSDTATFPSRQGQEKGRKQDKLVWEKLENDRITRAQSTAAAKLSRKSNKGKLEQK
jgi:hypothetical protein